MELREVGRVSVRIDGPVSRHSVVVLPGAGEDLDRYTALCERLHNSELRTVVVASTATPADVTAVVRELGLTWANLLGNGTGATLAWQVAARGAGIYGSLTVIDRGHPAVPDAAGQVLESACPPVEMPTTMLLGPNADPKVAELSGRRVYADFRVVHVAAADVVKDAMRELATEVALRTTPW